MKYVTIVFIFFLFFTMVNPIVLSVAFVSNVLKLAIFAKDVALFGRDAYKAYNKSGNIAEFMDNMDPMGQYQKRVEGKLNEIQASLTELQKTVDYLGFNNDLKHFNSHIKYPMKQIFLHFLKFTQHPSNSTLKSLTMQCHIHPPNIILERLNDMLSENWLIDQAKHYKYESPSVSGIIKKLDNIVEILTVCQAGCSGLEENEIAKFDLKKLNTNIKEIFQQIQRSKDVIHNSYFTFSQSAIKEYLSNYSTEGKTTGKMYAEIASDLVAHFQNKYNYGPLYTIWVGTRNMTANGNMPKDVAYSVRYNNFEVTVLRAASLCDREKYNETMYAVGKNLLTSSNIDTGSEIIIAYNKDDTCGYYSNRLNDVFATDGGLCGGGTTCRIIFAKRFPSNFTYKPLAPRLHHIRHMQGTYLDKNFQTIEEYHHGKKSFVELPDTVYVDEETLFVNQSFENIGDTDSIKKETQKESLLSNSPTVSLIKLIAFAAFSYIFFNY